jgi:hypothetical protein
VAINVTRFVWNRFHGSPAEKLVLLCMADFSDDKGNAWPSLETIMVRTGFTDRGVERVRRRLEKTGWLQCTDRGGGKGHSAHFRIVNPDRQSGNEGRGNHAQTPTLVPQTPTLDAPNPDSGSGELNNPLTTSPDTNEKPESNPGNGQAAKPINTRFKDPILIAQIQADLKRLKAGQPNNRQPAKKATA